MDDPIFYKRGWMLHEGFYIFYGEKNLLPNKSNPSEACECSILKEQNYSVIEGFINEIQDFRFAPDVVWPPKQVIFSVICVQHYCASINK